MNIGGSDQALPGGNLPGDVNGESYAWGMLISREGVILALTPAAAQHWQASMDVGASGESMVGKSAFDLLSEPSGLLFRRVLEHGVVWEGVFEASPKQPSVVMRGSLTPLLAGSASGYWLFLAFEVESSVSRLVSSVRMPCLFADDTGVIVQANNRLGELFGYEVDELVAQPVEVLVPELLRERHKELFERFASISQVTVPMGGYGDLKGRRRDGSLILFRASISRHFIDDQQGFLLVMEDINQQERFRRMLRWNERHDPLTGMPNRQAMIEHLDAFLVKLPPAETRFSFLVCDIDHFEQINEVHGHLVGDEVLRIAASRINRHSGTNVRAARLASDEFCLLSDTDTTFEQVQHHFEQLKDELSKPIHLAGNSFCLSVSAGVVLIGQDEPSSHDILRAAKLAVRAAKASGGDCLRCYNDDLRRDNARYHAIRAGLQADAFLNQLTIAVQPIVSAADGLVAGAEVLLRWRLDDQMVSPAEFIPVAEQGESIHAIGLWVFEAACKLSRELNDLLDGRQPFLSINLSTRQLDDANLPVRFAALLERHGVSANRLELEVTETAMMAHLEDNLRTLSMLGEMGFRCAVDDFGTGHSSLAQLLRMPVDKLKVDKVFIDDMDLRPDSLSIVSASIKLAHGLKMQVVAEGVERDSQLQELKRMGCDLIQGYYFHKPLSVEDFILLVKQQASQPNACAQKIHYLIYTSEASGVLTDEQLQALTVQVAPLNHHCDITGCLLAQGRVFMQMLEGPYDALHDTFNRIIRDHRHGNVRVIDEGAKSTRAFSDWRMQVRRLALPGSEDGRLETDSILPRVDLLDLASQPRACYSFLCSHAENIESLSG